MKFRTNIRVEFFSSEEFKKLSDDKKIIYKVIFEEKWRIERDIEDASRNWRWDATVSKLLERGDIVEKDFYGFLEDVRGLCLEGFSSMVTDITEDKAFDMDTLTDGHPRYLKDNLKHHAWYDYFSFIDGAKKMVGKCNGHRCALLCVLLKVSHKATPLPAQMLINKACEIVFSNPKTTLKKPPPANPNAYTRTIFEHMKKFTTNGGFTADFPVFWGSYQAYWANERQKGREENRVCPPHYDESRKKSCRQQFDRYFKKVK